MLAILLVSSLASLASAAEAAGPVSILRFANLQDPFQFLFGKESDQDRERLNQIEISAKVERDYGNRALRAYLDYLKRQGIRVVTRGRDVDYLHDLIQTIRPLLNDPQRYPSITVYVARSPQCDARVFPGGAVLLFDGMLEAAGSEAALVGVLGHELSHLDRDHLLVDLRRVRLAQDMFTGTGRGGQYSAREFFDVGPLILKMWTRPFRPEDELEADRDGARWACLAGYDAREFATVFHHLPDRLKDQRLLLPSFLQRHPATEERRRAVMEVYQKFRREQPNAALYRGKENVRARTARWRREFDD
jgi:predicted Zn-dependent protease